jgi:tripartite-type tricarboxylate transporter receptor subunit TctC
MKSNTLISLAAFGLVVGITLGASFAAHAQSVEEFYKGKQIRLIAGFAPGNDYDIGARFLAKYLTKHLPGHPTIIVQNMPQASSLASANFVYVQAPKDGTVISAPSRNITGQALTGQPNIEFDPRKFIWLGATSQPSRVCVKWHTVPINSPADLLTHEFIVAGSGAGTSTSLLPTVFNHVLGTKIKIVQGYKGSTDGILAIERGEVQGECASWAQFRTSEQLFREKKLVVLLRAEETPMAELPDVPSIFDLAKTDEQRQFMRFVFSSTEFGRPYLFPPGVPQDRVDAMRKAISDSVHDPELIAEAAKIKLDMAYHSPEQLEQLVANLYATPPALIDTIKKLIPAEK